MLPPPSSLLPPLLFSYIFATARAVRLIQKKDSETILPSSSALINPGRAADIKSAMVVKMVLWDNDGVLMDTESLFMLSNKRVLSQHGVELTQEQFCDFNLTQGKSVLELVSKGDEAKLVELRNERDKLYSELLAGRDCRIPGMLEVVQTVRRQCRMAIVTSSKRNHFELMHRNSRILEHMDFCLVSGDYPKSKPHPDPYLTAMQRAACSPAECLVVEDSPRGLQAAVAAGIKHQVRGHAKSSVCRQNMGAGSSCGPQARRAPRLLTRDGPCCLRLLTRLSASRQVDVQLNNILISFLLPHRTRRDLQTE
eukprot:755246-Hanusia_phi.AAC.1